LARVVTTFLLDALNDVYRRHTGLHDVRIAVGHYEADDVFVDLVRAGPDDPRAALRFSGCSGADPDPWEPVAHAQEGEISVERAFNGRAARIRVRCPASTPGPPRSERPTRRPPFRSG
jgi:hypothetical protein